MPSAAFLVARFHELFFGRVLPAADGSAACPGVPGRGLGSGGLAAWGCGPGRGWSGRGVGGAAGGVPEAEPFVLAVPVFGQVEGEVSSAVAGGAGGDGDEVAADGRGACARVQVAG